MTMNGTIDRMYEVTMTSKIIGYNVYRAESGSGLVYLGRAETLAEAKKLASSPGFGLDKCDWGTAHAAGHVCGMSAPTGIEADDPTEWYAGDVCAVAVYAG